MKKFLFVILSLTLMFGLIGCGKDDAKETDVAKEVEDTKAEETEASYVSPFNNPAAI